LFLSCYLLAYVLEDSYFLFSNGLVTSEGEKWRHHRKVLTPAFHFAFLKSLTPIMSKHIENFKQKLIQLNGEKVDPNSLLGDIFLNIIIDVSLDGQVDVHKVSEEYQKLNHLFIIAFFGNFLFGSLFKYLPFELAQRSQKHKENLSEILKIGIQNKKKHHEELKARGQEPQKDFISLMLSNNFSDEEIYDEILTFYFAAHDTTSSTLSWVLYFLCKYPEYQKQLRSEIESKSINLEELEEKLPLMKNIIQETLRMRPPVVTLGRETKNDCVLSGYSIPKGTVLSLMFINAHFDPNFWENPQEFNPERFSTKNEQNQNRHPFCYLPFSAGPRNCVGKRFGMQAMMTFLFHIIQSFELQGDTQGVIMDSSSLLKPKYFKMSFIPIQ